MNRILLLLFTLSCTLLMAQQIDMNVMGGIGPRSVGPAGMSGRVTSIAVVHEDPSTMIIGTASGGLWKSGSGGTDWNPIFDHQKVLSIGAVAIDQSNPDVIWVGTGEGNPRNSMASGYGIYKSMDGGKSWKSMGLEKTRNIHRVIIHPKNPEVVYVAALGTAWGENPERGVYKTTDGGKSWNKILYINEKVGCADLVIDPSNPNKLIAAMWEYRRWPWYFNSGGPGSGLYITYDGGTNWNEKTKDDGLPKGNLGRIGLAIAPSEPSVVYALVESKDNALYRSENGGEKWKMVNTKDEIGNRPFYYADLYVDPKNENRLYSLYSLVSKSEDGGRSFEVIMPYYGSTSVHPDHHAWWIHPEDPDFMINGNDGGMAITRDGGKSWRFVENLPLAQYYHINVDELMPYHIYGGMQDNGSWRGPAYVWRSGGIRNAYWEELYFGDGFDVMPDPEMPERYGYAMSQGGNLGRYDLKTGGSRFSKPVDAQGRDLRFNWNAAIAQDPFDPNTIYYGSQFVHKSTDKGTTWETISPDLTTDDPEKQKQSESGGLTIDATNAENYTTIVSISPSPIEKGLIWVGTDDGNVQLTRDGGQNWTNLIDNIKGAPENGGWICQIRPSMTNAGEAFVVMNNYRQNDWKPYLFHTTNYGKSWESMASSEQVWGYTLSFWQDVIEPNLMWLGTEFGLYLSFDGGKNWNQWTVDYPNVSSMDIAYQYNEDDVVIGTFGRAAYVFDHIQPLREIAATGGDAIEGKFTLFEGGKGVLAEYAQASGTRFAANAIFQGENRRYGLPITFYAHLDEEGEDKEEDKKEEDDEEKKKAKGSKNKVKFLIKSNADTIRTFDTKIDSSGVWVAYWDMREKGEPYPSRSSRTSDNEPSGPVVLPGKYLAVVSYGGISDSTEVEVLADPRVDFDRSRKAELRELQAELETLQGKAAKAVKQLIEAKSAVDLATRQFPAEKDSVAKALLKEAGSIKDSIDSIVEVFLGKDSDEVQGIQRDPDIVTAKLGMASYYIGSAEQENSTLELVMQQAKSKLKSALELTNNFMKNEYARFREDLEQVELSPFKKYEPVDMEE